MINENEEKKRAEIFLERKTTIHFSKINGEWGNGLIFEVGSNFFVVRDRTNGKESFIFFSELSKSLEPYKEVAA